MSAQPMPQPVQSASAAPAPVRTPPAAPAHPKLSVVPENSYAHTIEAGESLYVIARRYGVTTDAILHANNISSPDKIFVGQKIYIPGRPDLAPKRAETLPALRRRRSRTAEPVRFDPLQGPVALPGLS